MKKWIHIGALVAALTAFGTTATAQSSLKATLDYRTFYIPGQGSLVDLQFQYAAYSLSHKIDSTGMHASVGVYTAIKNAAGDTVQKISYILEGPIIRDSVLEDFFDVQQFIVPPGKYTASITLLDMNSDEPASEGDVEIVVPNRQNQLAVSDILIAELATPTTANTPFVKSGYEIIPRLSNFYGPQLNSIPYYIEVYHTNQLTDTVFGLQQRLFNERNEEIAGFSKLMRMKTGEVAPMIRNVDISKLPSGSYHLELAVVDKATLKPSEAKSVYYFDRVNELEMDVEISDLSNVILDPAFQASLTEDSLGYYLASLIPIARPAENKLIHETLKTKDLDKYRKHIQQFWIQTSGAKASSAWLEYKKQVQFVQRLYGTNFQDGFETDRGRVYLQYGPPNQITSRETSPTEYPYEIWQYDAIKQYHNKRFIFYNPDLTNNAYRLLHSDMLGEPQNRGWQQALSKRTTPNGTIDDPNMNNPGGYGSNSSIYYRQF